MNDGVSVRCVERMGVEPRLIITKLSKLRCDIIN